MTFSRLANGTFIGLIGLCFFLSLGRILTRQAEEHSGTRTIRIAHWELESGLRSALDKLAREYERLHPGVRIEQMPIPEKVYPTWQETQLVGETAPDLIELGRQTDDMLGRYFLPISTWVEEPNPYNAGTDLEKAPWRATFIDGLSDAPAYSESLIHYYGIPLSMFTLRVYYNVELLRQITGNDRPPKTWDEFLELCRQAAAFRTPSGGTVLPIAGSQYNAPYVMDALFRSQTQKLTSQLDRKGSIQPSQADVAYGYLDGTWSLKTKSIRDGLELMRLAGRYMQPGFMQVGRDDAMFYFAQGRALMICSGSWDASSIRNQVPFAIGVFRLPVPERGHPTFGGNVLGQSSEAGSLGGLTFGVTAKSLNRKTAIDFLRFLSSRHGNQVFTETSGWLPSVVGVVPPKQVRPFMPVTEGCINGFGLAISGPSLYPDTARLLNINLYLLTEHGGSVEKFVEGIDGGYGGYGGYGEALKSDLRRQAKNAARNVELNDTPLAAYWFLAAGKGDRDAFRKFDMVLEAQNGREKSSSQMRNLLNKQGK